MTTNNKPDPDQAVNIEDIMQDVRDEILSRSLPGQARRPQAPRTLPPDFYEHLYRAGLAQSELTIKPPIIKSNTPIIGPLLDRIRQQFHNLAAYYFDHLAYKQSEINHHVLQALNQIDQQTAGQNDAGTQMQHEDRGGKAGREAEAATPDDIRACYRLLLGRAPEADEWQDWMARLARQEVRRVDVVDSFLSDPEFVNLRERKERTVTG